MPTALDFADGDPQLTDAVRRSRKLLHRRALVAAAAGTVPVPGLDWAVDAALLSRLIPAINAEFGLTPDQIDQLDPHQREQVQKAVGLVGSVLIGKFITRDLVLKAATTIGLRLTAGQAAKYVPLAGQAVSALVGYSAIRFLGEEHLKDCVRVARKAQLALPAPAAPPVPAPRKTLLQRLGRRQG
ncbi:hypothetical protein [Pseudorhodoferax sp. Leaf267]|uniref:hypothetical protein n=1 Tax=Pseudorhodoferax sp. Leaf267 TaxID=1736316 RepID=UPI0006F56DF5|nr:hypothetical protein [Pseudorhodoferax sp. Leaf267]KQP14962.1 hypothetical protein ASF43_12990 [Pseudorhodoferax sp. Leaf267]